MLYFFSGNYSRRPTKYYAKDMLKVYSPLIRNFLERHSLEINKPDITITDFTKQKEVDRLKTKMDRMNRGDFILATALTDISPSAVKSVKKLKKMSDNGIKTYVLSLSPVDEFSLYSSSLSHTINWYNNDGRTNKKTKYDDDLYEYCAKLRETYPQVCFEDLTKYTGIPRTAIIQYIIRTRPVYPKRKKSRKITAEEIEMIRSIKEL